MIVELMPNTKTAKKALRQNIRRRARNLAKQRQIKIVTKTFKRTAESGDLTATAEQLKTVYKTLDKAAKTKVISKNKAARLKSRLSKKLVVSSPVK